MNRKKVLDAIRILEDCYGVPAGPQADPVDLLVMTILSQNTSDANSLPAFERLKSSLASYELLLSASDGQIADQIRSGGLAEIKAGRIKAALAKIKHDRGEIKLDFLAEMDRDSAREYLLSLPGVGPKTASIVLLFGFGQAAMPVDTHVYRVSRRLGLVPEKASIDMAQRILEEITPVKKYLSLHLNLINHGRAVCRARNPRHGQCALCGICDFYLRGTSLK